MLLEAPLMSSYTVRPVNAVVLRPDCVEYTSDLDRARDVALSLCEELQVDVGVYQHLGSGTCLWEVYDFASYG